VRPRDKLIESLKVERLKLDQAIACHRLASTEGYATLMTAVADEIRGYGKRLMAMDCEHDETNQLRAKITALNWFMRWTPREGAQVDVIVKRMEGLQRMALNMHDPGTKVSDAELEKLIAEIQQFRTEVQTP